MKKYLFLLITIFLFYNPQLFSQPVQSSITWIVDRTDSIGGFIASALPHLPKVIATPYGKSVLFTCKDSTALMVNTNPLEADTAFTIEVFFRPDSTVLSGANNEQRFLHIRNSANDNRRILLETRILPNQRWLLDTYIKSETSNLTLVDSSISHTCSEWHHIALTYGNGIMKQYVDGTLIKSGTVKYLPIYASPRTSIGSRQDPRSWFNGAIRMIKFTRTVLTPAEFTIPAPVGTGESNIQSKNGTLGQNFPNPFNPSTSIRYELPFEGAVQIDIVDVTGQRVKSVLNQVQTAGLHKEILRAEELSSGVYFYVLHAKATNGTQDFRQAKKMIVCK